mgnify:CR=1 FL=1
MLERFSIKLQRYRIPLLIAVFAVACLIPFCVQSAYVLRICVVALMNIILALSLNMMIGLLGQMSFGHAAFFGIGAYTAALLSTKLKLPAELTFPAAMAMAGLFGILLGLPVLKLKGYYFVIVTMVFCEIMRIIELNWMDLTRGPLGIMAIPKPSFFGFKISSQREFYFLALILVIITLVVICNIMNSRIGYAIMAIRDDELAASSMGVDIFKYKILVFVISSCFAGLAGALYAQYTGYIDPTSFTNNKSNELLVMVIFGGLGNLLGSFIGAITLSVVPELLRGLATYRQLIYGIVLVLLMMVRPDGLLGSINFKYLGQRDRCLQGQDKNREKRRTFPWKKC